MAAVPTVLLGGLVGAGVGGVHGPFIKLGGGKKEGTPMTEEEIQKQAAKEAEKLDQAVEKSATTVPQPPAEDEAATAPMPKKKPRKLEVRSKPQPNNAA